ncbi:hypothetical protein SY83_15020 [Paenibacillus swuensis]|uniref:PASTA domain-containing protein n=1 Tax=Paenibacillus swuensis TaxID=1178515 RepID=A0A172TKC2_9BACL|nr:penicillin-binding transpeptidase domain-containing protein [Paenibacillus swuensis]ANE47364.1 hypothetical protein SY83_15020 [Paenibacillus swuensis]
MAKKNRMRTLFMGGVITLLFTYILVQVFMVQVADNAFWLAKAEQQWAANKSILPVRGAITDRNGKVLAKDGEAFTIAVNPEVINQQGTEDEMVAGLHKILGIPEEKLKANVIAKNKEGKFYKYRALGRDGQKVDTDTADKVLAFRDELRKSVAKELGKKKVNNVGIILEEDSKRYYPKDVMASHVLGYLNKQGEPATGLEALYNKQLSGTAGSIGYEKDLLGRRLPDSKVEYKAAVDGKNVKLTLDENIQHYIEDALKKADDQFHPKSMTAIAVDPKTMEILGLANTPNYNPNEYWDFNEESKSNHAVASMYEPGSTFKIVTLAAAVEEGLFDPNGTYMSGSIRIPGGTTRDIRRNGWGKITYLEGLKRSSNVAFVKLGYEKLGPEKFLDYIHKFGFGQKTGVDISGETSRQVNFNSRTDEATATYGQGAVLVTPMQQVAAVAAVANGGKLMRPHIVKEITDPVTGKVLQKFEPKETAQVISPETSAKVNGYLEQVVADRKIGTGRNAFIEGYRVAGKTGTAQKVIGKGYSDEKYVVSFIGYAPVEDPKILVYVLVDEPDVPADQGGGYVAAPIFKEIVSQSLRYMQIPSSTKGKNTSTVEEMEPGIAVPNVLGMNVADAKAALKTGNIRSLTLGKGKKVSEQVPIANGKMGSGQKMFLLTEPIDKVKVPDLSGQPIQDVVQICSMLDMVCDVTGEGYVSAQSVTSVNGKRVLKVAMKPMSVTEAAKASQQAQEQPKSEAKAG